MPKPRKRRYHGARHILNKPGYHTTGVIVAELEDTSTWHDGCRADGRPIEDTWDLIPSSVLQIADCSRTITLSVDMHSPEDRENTKYKLDRMIDALTKFRAGIDLEEQRIKERLPIALAAEREAEKLRKS
jgi:hypothetical protein